MPEHHEPPNPNKAVPHAPDIRYIHLWQIQPVRDALVIAAVIGLVYLGYVLSIVTVPILLALLLAYLFEPLVALVTRRGAGGDAAGGGGGDHRVLMVVVVIVPVCIGATFAVYQGVRFVTSTANNIDLVMVSISKPEDQEAKSRVHPGAWTKIRDYIVEQEDLRKKLVPPVAAAPTEPPAPGTTEPQQVPLPEGAPSDIGQGPSELYKLVQLLLASARANASDINRRLVTAGTGLLGGALGLVGSFGRLVFSGFLTAFFFFFFCTGWGRVLSFWEGLIPERRKGRAMDLVGKMDRVIAGFVRGRLTVAACMMVFYTLGYWLVGAACADPRAGDGLAGDHSLC